MGICLTHSSGNATDTEFVSHDQNRDTEVLTGFRAVVAHLYHDNPEKGMKARSQFLVH